jgi:hypothetical protein
MMTTTDPRLSEMVEKDIAFTVHHPGPSGNVTLALPADEVARYCADPPGYLAERYGVARSDYLGWHRSDYQVLCAARRRDGKACRGVVPGGSLVPDPKRWAELQGGYCHTHGEGT